jgi:hypothetical protein
MTNDLQALRAVFDFQIRGCGLLGSTFSAAVLSIVIDNIEAGGPCADLAAAWAGLDFNGLVEAAAPLRPLGGLHYLTLSGLAPALAAQYPAARAEPDLAALKCEVIAAAHAHLGVLADFATRPPQTNEVRRSLCLVGGFLTVARLTGLPLRCLEIGASAGLNLNWNRYRYDLGDLGAWGDATSPVSLDGDWQGEPPPFDVAARVIERAGCDLAPVDLADPDRALRLQAYIWADQPDRLARLRAAVAVARDYPPKVDTADAGAWALRMTPPKAGMATVLYHSVVWSYLPPDTRTDIEQAIRTAGEAARPDRPFAWLRMEPKAGDPNAAMEVFLTLWPGGEQHSLARVHPHGAKVLWSGA